MNVRSVIYYLAEAFISLFRNRLMSVASILTVSSCTLIFTVSFCVAANVDYLLEQVENTVGLSVIIENSITADEVNELFLVVQNIEHVSYVGYISSEMALEIYRETFGEGGYEILEGLEEDNPLPRSFDIKVDNNIYQEQVIAELQRYVGRGFEKVRHESDLINILLTISHSIRMVSAVIILALSLISVIIIMNTIRLTVNMRSMEINIMKYVGATDSFIRAPFIIEGIIIGLIGSAISTAAGAYGYEKAVIAIMNVPAFSGIASFKTSNELFWFIVPVSVVSGAFIGSVGSILSMRKYLLV